MWYELVGLTKRNMENVNPKRGNRDEGVIFGLGGGGGGWRRNQRSWYQFWVCRCLLILCAFVVIHQVAVAVNHPASQ